MLWLLLLLVLSPSNTFAALPALDSRLSIARRLVAGGAVVLMVDARSGAEIFAGGPVDDPLPPGSIVKLLVALSAGAERPEILTQPRVCPARQPGSLHGPADGHGSVDLEGALARSCNRYFALLGRELGTARILGTAAALGLALPSPPSDIPASELALGTGLRLSARQLLVLLRAVAPADPGAEIPLLRVGASGSDEERAAEAQTRQRVRDGLCRAVSEGTARAAGEGTSACGKTGTAVLGQGFIGWFVGYTPRVAPQMFLILGLPGKLGRDAARAARPLLSAASR